MRSSHLPFKMHEVGYVRSSLLPCMVMHVGSIATPNKNYHLISVVLYLFGMNVK